VVSEVEYVAVVQVHRVERNVVPKVTSGTIRRTVAEDRTTRQKAEVLAFTVRAKQPYQVKNMVREMMAAGLPNEPVGEPIDEEEEEMEDDR
jgi:hypothetical protein